MKKLFSIRKMKKMMLLLFLIPMFLLQAIQSSHFLRVLNEEMAQNGREILSLHQNALDDDISRIANSISSYWALDYSHSKLLYHQSDFNAYQYSYNVLKEYRSLMSLEPSIGALLLISQANHMVLGAYNDSMISYGEKDVLQDFAQNLTLCWDTQVSSPGSPSKLGSGFIWPGCSATRQREPSVLFHWTKRFKPISLLTTPLRISFFSQMERGFPSPWTLWERR